MTDSSFLKSATVSLLAVALISACDVPATFSEAAALTEAMFVLRPDASIMPASLSYASAVAALDPAVKLAVDEVWTPEVGTKVALGPAPLRLGTAGDFVILAKSGIVTVPTSALTGDIGVSPIDSTALTGLSLTMDSTNTFATSRQITGRAFASDYAAPTPSNLTTAVNNMEAAFADAAGRPNPDFTELASGDLGGLTLVPGLYKWGTDVEISTDVTLSGGPDDVWILQIDGDLTIAADATVVLAGGASPKNIFWQAFGAVELEAPSHLEGIVLSTTEITLATGATVNGRLLSQTRVSLDESTVVQPAP
jgi:Ice-binding-like